MNKKLLTALYVNAGLLALLIVVLVLRPSGPMLESPSMAQQVGIAGGNGVFVMPAQLTVNTWGCFLLDIDAKTLATYQFEPANKTLRFIAGRNIDFDRRVGNFNTLPSPSDIRELVEKERQPSRMNPAVTQPTSPEK